MSAPEAGLDIIGSFDHLRDALFRYYDTPFGLANKALEDERRRLLDVDGGAWRRPLIEIRPQYQSSGMDIAASVREAGAPDELAGLISAGMMEGVPSLYSHQHQALVSAVRDGKDVVITAGTGSGKTESFMLPVLAELVRESAGWTGLPAQGAPWWSSPTGAYVPQRRGETGHQPAVRAMVLYPMNALVDDQMMRLRKTLDGDAARQWAARHRNGHRFYFGRYTGATPVSGEPDSKPAVARLRELLQETGKRSEQARKDGQDDSARYFVPRLDGAEMRSRWDMIDSPPDILITNYSMLNVMLLRAREDRIFEQTRRWLESDPSAKFTLIVDELHMYRGTAGTEVAYLLRNLRTRLGLDERPDQFRVLAASASLDPQRDRAFLQEFFGVPEDRFEVLGGDLVLPRSGTTELSAHADRYVSLGAQPDPGDAAKALKETDGAAAIVNALYDGKQLVARPDEDVAAALFGQAEREKRSQALRGLLAALRRADASAGDLPKLRGHLFFRNIPGVWACSDPQCPGAEQREDGDRTVGRLFTRPTPRCSACSSRVLELLYCQNCGDVMLGGYAPVKAVAGKRFDAGLLPDLPDLANLPDRAAASASAGNYVVYWPRTREPLEKSWSGNADGGKQTAEFAFKRSKYTPKTGQLSNVTRNHTGWSFHVAVSNKSKRLSPEQLPGAPTRCPSCGDDWETRVLPGNNHLSLSDPRRMRTPVRSMRTGFEKINQVLTTGVLSTLEEKKAVIFSDSRQDAAKLAAGLGLRHYQDLLRLLLAGHVMEQGDPAGDVRLVRGYFTGEDKRDREAAAEAWKRLQRRDLKAAQELKAIWKPDDFDEPAAPGREEELIAHLGKLPSLFTFAAEMEEDLLGMGVNPGGPKDSLKQVEYLKGAVRHSWTSLYDWSKERVEPKLGLEERQQRLRDGISESLRTEMLTGLFGSAGRDFESLGLGWLCLVSDAAPLDLDPSSDTSLVRASLRVLGHLRRFRGLRDGLSNPPRPLRLFWEAVADQSGQGLEDIQKRVERAWGSAVSGYVIDPEKVGIRTGGQQAWVCPKCKRRHLHRGVGICTKAKCGKPLPLEPEAFEGTEKDYYAWQASNGEGRFRLNCAELTGQTDKLDAQARQARFQRIFLDESEFEKPDEVDVLSVTTTMEAGVDIGSLAVVLMANMPPTRFNYQQRVGRAGRRGSPVALALTVCRGRSHDEHYFQEPERITNDETPPPYLSTDMPDIYRRVLTAEVLRRAFAEVGGAGADGVTLDPTRNVHGQFGTAADWEAARPSISRWLSAHAAEIARLADFLAAYTRTPGQAAAACRWVAEDLISEISRVSGAEYGHPDLSQRLAEEGLLPMFGFPTGVRYLYTQRPKKPYPWPPAGVVDRDLPIAVSQFAPGAETVKDGAVFTAAGVVGFRPFGREPQAVADPLGSRMRIGLCRSCSHVEESAPDTEAAEGEILVCPACGADDGTYSRIELRQPTGFFAPSTKPFRRDFDGNFAWSARSLAPRTGADLESENGAPRRDVGVGGVLVHSGKGRRYVVNDNGGKLFNFAPLQSTNLLWSGAWMETGVAEAAPWFKLAQDEPASVALGAMQRTDLFLLGPEKPVLRDAGLRLNLSAGVQRSGFREDTTGRKAAWYSLAALLRKAAGTMLDIQPGEIAAGIHGAASSGGEARVFAFLADTLDNGAGYCTHLAEPETFSELLGVTDALLAKYRSGAHGDECRGSCYECLRDYTNMAYHALLDWRLAADLLGVLRGRELTYDRDEAGQLLDHWAADTIGAEHMTAELASGPAVVFADSIAVCVKHPLEGADEAVEARRLTEVRSEIEKAGGGIESVVFVDNFLLERVPSMVTAKLQGFSPD
ncbi:DEAD/DEAH box helicase [Streptomyces xinghaiensis]|uniref:DEAD/DEAH box helicase n=1 Tax=Streptomyces xinghaiensis TaxID=1038928 RepID=UPI00059478AA|nr:DEAD/DEAH box helicase [Streptomyces xinghaiensis]